MRENRQASKPWEESLIMYLMMKSLAAKIRFWMHEYAIMFAHQNAFSPLKVAGATWFLGGPKRGDGSAGVDFCGCKNSWGIGLFSFDWKHVGCVWNVIPPVHSGLGINWSVWTHINDHSVLGELAWTSKSRVEIIQGLQTKGLGCGPSSSLLWFWPQIFHP